MGPSNAHQFQFATLTLSAANYQYFTPILPIMVLYVGFIVTTTLTTTAAVLTWDIIKAAVAASAGTAVSPTGAAALGTTTATSSTMARGLGVFLDVLAVKGTRIVYPGESVCAYASTTAAAGAVTPVMVYQNLGFPTGAGVRDYVSSHPGSTTNALPTSSLTEVTA